MGNIVTLHYNASELLIYMLLYDISDIIYTIYF